MTYPVMIQSGIILKEVRFFAIKDFVTEDL